MSLYIRNLADYTKEFGFFPALSLILQRKLNCKMIKIKPKGIKHWVYCRNGTSDFAVLRQVIGKKECAFPLKDIPQSIVDIGANVGYASILFSNLWPSAKIVAVEPENENFDLLVKNTQKYSNITCMNTALWSRKCNLKISNPNAAAFSFQFTEANTNDSPTIISITIDELKKFFLSKHIDLLKIDIEGGEYEFFKNTESSWDEGISMIAVELHERYAEGVTNLVLKKMNNRKVTVCGEYFTFLKQ